MEAVYTQLSSTEPTELNAGDTRKSQLMPVSRRARQRKLINKTDLRKQVIDRLKNGWTPEQIGYRVIHERAQLRVCQETIYRYIYPKTARAMIYGGTSRGTVSD
tara:strand:- start:566 stop:877 length:312 start_codon:yes stop_codon:yes gene_type:complete